MKKIKKLLLSLACISMAFNILMTSSCDLNSNQTGKESTSESGATSESSGSENNSDNNSEIEGCQSNQQ